ncbi:MAG: hypothetical protein J0M12_13155, partial [Deltaproteobacteria bacterium]|nr:hypothetical protein [Deltaproteobacteria bacterium]
MIQTAPLYYLCMSAVAQVLAVGVTVLLSRTGVLPANSLLIVALQAGIAFITARTLKLSLPWQILNLLLVPALFFYAHFGMPPWLALGGLILSLIIYVPTFWTRVPFYPTSAPMYEEILKRLPENRDFTFIDLGCG